MTPTELYTQLQALVEAQLATQQETDARRAAILEERQQIQQEQLRLQARLDAAILAERELTRQETQQSDAFAAEQTRAITAHLEKCQGALDQALSRAAQRQELISQRAAMLEEQPDLLDAMAKFGAFEANKDKVLATLPDIYRDSLLAVHETLAQRIQPLRRLDDQIRQASPDAAVELVCPLYVDQDRAEFNLVLPVSGDVLTETATPQAQLAHQVVDGIQTALFEMSKGDAWEVAAMDERTWSSFVAIELLAEYTDDQNTVHSSDAIARGLEAALARHFEERPSSAPVPMTLRLVAVSPAAWQLGLQHEPVAQAETVAVETEEEAAGVPEGTPEEILHLPDNGWYTDDDIRSWQRQVRVAADSKWSREARQIRTLLMRLISRGLVGEHGVVAAELWKPLPADLAEVMRGHIDRLREREVLLTTGDDTDHEAHSVAVNPTYLEEMQNLINRTVSPFWEDLVAAAPAATT